MFFSRYDIAMTLEIIGEVLLSILLFILKLIRVVIYGIATFFSYITSILLPFGLYFGYRVLKEMVRSGVAFSDTEFYGPFFFAFGVPAFFIIVAAITGPKE